MEILIVGGGYIGMYTARRLERLLGEIGQQPVVEQLARYRGYPVDGHAMGLWVSPHFALR